MPRVRMDRAHTRGTRESDGVETGLWGDYDHRENGSVAGQSR